MSESKTDDQWLDEQLAKPAIIADRGFSIRLQKQIIRNNSRRKTVFTSAGCIWVFVALIFLSPQTVSRFYDRLLAQVMQTDEIILSATELLLTGQFSLQAYLLPLLVIMLIFYGLYTSFQSIR